MTCPAGHPLTGAWKFDMWCEQCGADVIAISPPPDYQPPDPDEDEIAALYADAMAMTND